MGIAKIDYQLCEQEEIKSSLDNFGCILFKNTNIDLVLLKNLAEQWRNFFSSTSSYKTQFSNKEDDGYFPQDAVEIPKEGIERDFKEFYQTRKQYLPPEIKKVNHESLSNYLRELSINVLHHLDNIIPDENKFNEMPLADLITNEHYSVLRVNFYPKFSHQNSLQSHVRALSHTDFNLITLIPISAVPGLQIYAKDDWHEIPADGEILVLIGEQLQIISNGYLKATHHRVTNPNSLMCSSNVDRISLPYFVHLSPEVLISSNRTSGQYFTQQLLDFGYNVAEIK